MNKKTSLYVLLDQRVQKWIWNQGWTSLRDIQEEAIPLILKGGNDLIISAETAGGKTEAVFLPILSILVKQENCGYQVLYISPLKSLINDQYRRLKDMTREMEITITPWHGDISSSKKMNSLDHPHGIVIITPESLESLFINHHNETKRAFKNLSYIIIDELHCFIPTERGKQLQSLLSRLELIIGKSIPRIAMSATFSDYEIVKRFLRYNNSFPCMVLNSKKNTHETKILIKEYFYGYNEKKIIEQKIANDIFEKLRGTNNLVFTNSRRDCEQIGKLLREKSKKENVPNEFKLHHSSLSKEIRRNVEQELQAGITPTTAICTATMELGVDIGEVKSIAQIESAYSVCGLRQRLGRSGRRGEPSILRIYSYDYSGKDERLLDKLKVNLIQNIAIIELLREHQYEIPNIKGLHLSTFIQQLLSLLGEFGSISPKEGWTLLCEKGAFKNVEPSIYLELLKNLGENQVITQSSNGNILMGKTGEEIINSKDFYAAFNAIPEYEIINCINGQHIGSLIKFFGLGAMIILDGSKWEVVKIDNNNTCVYVIPAKEGKVSKFMGNYIEIDSIVTSKMKEIYKSIEIYQYLDKNSEEGIRKARDYFKKNDLDDYNQFFYDNKECILTFAGTKTNRTISLISQMLLNKTIGYSFLHTIGLNMKDISTILSFSKPKAEELCKYLMRPIKEIQKYDYLLSDKLLNIEYASTYIDVEAAWMILKKINKSNDDSI